MIPVHKLFRRWLVPAILLVAALVPTACMKQENYPDTPEIAFEQFLLGFDTGRIAKTGILTISFKDGNGDIGLYPRDTTFPYQRGGDYYYNYVIQYYEKQLGKFVLVPLDPPYSARIPYLVPGNPGKPIKGVIVDTLTLNPFPVYDTVKFVFFIYDRALNKSNIDSTPPIILRRP